MAGEWIPMRLDLGTDPAVVSVALTLDMDEYAVVGRLHKLWVWANQHTLNGHAKGVTENWLDRFLSAPGFTSALENAGWLKVENDGVRVPKFDLWNSQGAKRRLDASKRQQKARSTRHTSVTKMSQDSVTPVTKKCDKSVTRVEESREEKRREKKEVKTEDSSAMATPPHEPTTAMKPTPVGVLTFPCSGSVDSWLLTQKQIDDWAALYPGLDILAECRKALAWISAKGHKTAKGMPAFLVNWFNRSTDRNSQGSNQRPAFQTKGQQLDDYLRTQFTGLQ